MSSPCNVYGIGNALVDIQYKVELGFLEKMHIQKGVMTLVDEERQGELMESLRGVPAGRSSGGSAANTMIGVANLGGTARYACKVGRDELGEFFLNDLEAAGVACNRSNRGDGITGKCLVFITPDADRTMNTFLGITSSFGPEQVEPEGIARSDYLYIEGYLLSSEEGFQAACTAQGYARQHSTRVSLTLSDPFIVDAFRDRIGQLLDRGVDLLFCNDAEARAYAGVSTTEAAGEALARVVPRVAVTCGAEGAVLRDDAGAMRIPGIPVEAVDTNGAGDMFAGAFLFGITHGYDVTQAGRLATYASSRVVAQRGPRLVESLKDRVEQILER